MDVAPFMQNQFTMGAGRSPECSSTSICRRGLPAFVANGYEAAAFSPQELFPAS